MLGVVSNKPHEFVTQIVEQYFPGVFDSVAGQQGTLVKPDPAALNRVIADFKLQPDQVLYVGDSNVDIFTARNAKTADCGVLWGFRGRRSWRRRAPTTSRRRRRISSPLYLQRTAPRCCGGALRSLPF